MTRNIINKYKLKRENKIVYEIAGRKTKIFKYKFDPKCYFIQMHQIENDL